MKSFRMKDQDLKELDGCKKWTEKMGSGYIWSYYEDNFPAPPGLTRLQTRFTEKSLTAGGY